MGKGLICKVNKTKGPECYADTDFAGGWTPSNPLNPDNALSISGFVIMCASIHIF